MHSEIETGSRVAALGLIAFMAPACRFEVPDNRVELKHGGLVALGVGWPVLLSCCVSRQTATG
jgi:hypothetical protein